MASFVDNPEAYSDPKKELKKIIGFEGRIKYCKIKFSIEDAEKKCESFREFLSYLRN